MFAVPERPRNGKQLTELAGTLHDQATAWQGFFDGDLPEKLAAAIERKMLTEGVPGRDSALLADSIKQAMQNAESAFQMIEASSLSLISYLSAARDKVARAHAESREIFDL